MWHSSTQIASSIIPPCEQLGLSEEMLIEPLPTSAIRLKKRLRRNTECFLGEETPEKRVLTIIKQQFLDENKTDEYSYMMVQPTDKPVTAS